MSKRFSTMPKGEARPLGTKTPKRIKTSKPISKDAALLQPRNVVSMPREAKQTDDINVAMPELLPQHEANVKTFDHNAFLQQLHDSACTASAIPVVSSQTAIMPLDSKDPIMTTLTKSGLSKNGKVAMFTGLRHVLRVPIAVFVNGTPETFEVSGEFAAPKAKETKEQRKARLKAAPKPTLAEKIAKREAAIAKLKAQLVAEATA